MHSTWLIDWFSGKFKMITKEDIAMDAEARKDWHLVSNQVDSVHFSPERFSEHKE